MQPLAEAAQKRPRPRRFQLHGRFRVSGVAVMDTFDSQARLGVGEAALYFGLDRTVINNWYVRGHLKDVTHDSKGRRLYLFEELLEAEARTRQHRNSHRTRRLASA